MNNIILSEKSSEALDNFFDNYSNCFGEVKPFPRALSQVSCNSHRPINLRPFKPSSAVAKLNTVVSVFPQDAASPKIEAEQIEAKTRRRLQKQIELENGKTENKINARKPSRYTNIEMTKRSTTKRKSQTTKRFTTI